MSTSRPFATVRVPEPSSPTPVIDIRDLSTLPAILSRAEVAAVARRSVRSIEREQQRGTLRCLTRYGERARYARSDVLAWLNLDGGAV